MSTQNAATAPETHKKRRRSNKPDEGPARQRRKVSDVNSRLGKTNGDANGTKDAETIQSGQESLAVQPVDTTKRKRRHSRRKSDAALTPIAHKQPKPESGRWHFGPTRRAGRYLCHDPIFSRDERTLFAAMGASVKMLSVEDSVQDGAFSHPENDTVVGYALSESNPSHVYAAYANSSGLLQWDWSKRALNAHIYTDLENITSLAVGARADKDEDLVWTVQRSSSGSYIALNGRKVFTPKDQTHPIQNLSADGSLVLASTGSTIILGSAQPGSSDAEPKTLFAEFQSNAEITCLAARLTMTSGKKGRQQRQSVSLAVGNVNGEIFLYQDVPLTGASGLATPRTLHWHSQPVATVKWSHDGNYLVSGGRETVLVLWQLETGKKQFLPHLAAEIEHIAISPNGTKYAVQLADNSIMVLSTSELIPIANFAGLQAVVHVSTSPVMTKRRPQDAANPTPSLFTATAAIHPTRPNELLAAVAASTLTSDASDQQSTAPQPFLQTFDMESERHIARQALSRNKLTDFRTGPEGNVIQEPNVTFLSISQDGEWLATVEVWSPPERDTSYLAATPSVNAEHIKLRTEIYLKFWHWNAQKSVWALDTRIDNPHPSGLDDRPGQVLALVSDPAETSFATIGEDATVRVWRPQTRRRNGVMVKGEHNTEWKARRVVALESACDPDEPVDLSAALAFSADGSLLAISLAPLAASSPAPVDFIHIPTGELLQPQCGIYTGHLVAMAFLGRNLVILSSTSVTVWDVVTASLTHRTKLDDAKTLLHPLSARTRILAKTDSSVNMNTTRSEARFAVALPVETKSASTGALSAVSAATRVVVYSPCAPFQKVFDGVLDGVVTALFAGPERGFRCLLASGEMLSLEPSPAVAPGVELGDAAGHEVAVEEPEEVVVDAGADADVGGDDVDGEDGGDAEMLGDSVSVPMLPEVDESSRLVRADQLAKVLEGPDALNMSVSAMFDAVVGLFARKAIV